MDARPGRICLSANRCLQSNSNTDRIANSYAYPDLNGHRNANGYCNTDGYDDPDSATYSHSEARADTATASHAGATPIGAKPRWWIAVGDRWIA